MTIEQEELDVDRLMSLTLDLHRQSLDHCLHVTTIDERYDDLRFIPLFLVDMMENFGRSTVLDALEFRARLVNHETTTAARFVSREPDFLTLAGEMVTYISVLKQKRKNYLKNNQPRKIDARQLKLKQSTLDYYNQNKEVSI
jgi:hypothetical protein